jgi:GAF domain-containing protein
MAWANNGMRKEDSMQTKSRKLGTEKKEELYYQHYFFQTFRSIMQRISTAKRLDQVLDTIAEDLSKVLGVKGSSLWLIDRKKRTLELASSYGLSDQYLYKGPLHSDRSIRECMDGISVCVDDVANDPRIEYPEEAVREGISSILSVPIQFKNRIIGVLRIYTAVPTEFDHQDIDFAEGLTQLAGMVIEYHRLLKGFKTSLDALKGQRKAVTKGKRV